MQYIPGITMKTPAKLTSPAEKLKDSDILHNYQEAEKLLKNPKTWTGLTTRVNWTGKKGEEINPLTKAIILECFYQLLCFYTEDDSQSVSLAQVHKWVFEFLGEDKETLATEDENYWRNKIKEANNQGQGKKGIVNAVLDILCQPNPIIWLEKNPKKYYMRIGEYAYQFCLVMHSNNFKSRRSYQAPENLPQTRKPSGKKAGKISYAQIETQQQTEIVLKILERRHLWLRSQAYHIADQMTQENSQDNLHPYQKLIFNKIVKGKLSQKQRQLYKKFLRRIAILEKLDDFPKDCYTPLANRFYSQSSGRIQPQWLHPTDISEKAGQCEQYAGGVRQAIFCATPDGVELSALDCNASAWQIVSIFLGDINTQKIACGPGCNFNSTMTEKAIKGDYFVKEKLETEEGRQQARNLVKKLLMTVLYGSTANEQYLKSFALGLGNYWQPPEGDKKNGADRFLTDCEDEFPILKTYVKLMKKVAKIASKKLGSFQLPYIFEDDAWLNFDHPLQKSITIKTSRQTPNGKRKDYSVTLQNAISLVENGRFVTVNPKEVGKTLPPTVIHSIDSAIIKHLILLLDQELPAEYGFATIHDCLLYPKGFICLDRLQQLWNLSLQLTYKSLGPLYCKIIEILRLDAKEAEKYLHLAEEIYDLWQSNVSDRLFVDNLWLSTSIEY